MESYHIRGGKRLSGEVNLQGAKNATLPILAATLAIGGCSVINNCPIISDVEKMLDLLNSLGCKCRREKNVVIADTNKLSECHISDEQMKCMRSSIFLTGAILGRCGEVEIGQPGGCKIGKRPIDIHLKGLSRLGAEIETTGEKIICKAKQLRGTDIRLDFPSVGATENIMLAAIFAKGETHIENCACEPEIVDLANYLIKCGADIKGAGTKNIYIRGEKALCPSEYKIINDRIEAGTFISAVASAGGDIFIRGAEYMHLKAVIHKYVEAGCTIVAEKNGLRVKRIGKLKAVDMTTAVFPGFPTDLQSPFVSSMIKAEGQSIVTEEIFENRFNYIKYLKTMNSNIEILGKSAIINGVSNINGEEVAAEDLRGGAALVIAALCAEGKTVVRGINHIDRGYEKLHVKLKSLGADISIQKE